LFLVLVLISLQPGIIAQRLPVLKQIDLPHSYYYREMYLPELTTGPSSVAWIPNGGKSTALVYSMQGSLWQQDLNSTAAKQLTDGPGYDYQPSVSPNGRWVVFSKYNDDAIELWVFDLKSGEAKKLTSSRAVNVEPRFSPDGTRIAFVSTQFNGHFHIFIAQFDQQSGQLRSARRLTGETRSTLPRYYYSPFDHELSPTWSPDGNEIIYISNRGHIHGTGSFWRMSAEPPAGAAQPMPRGPFARLAQQSPTVDPGREIHYEETNWKARPDWSPDGKRLVYASYLGRSWHQIWIMTSEGGDVFPLTYGDYDNTNPRWSPDGSEIAFISNRSGNTEIWFQNARSGEQRKLEIKSLKYLHPRGTVDLKIVDRTGHPTSARIFLTAADGRSFAPRNAWMAADDSFDRTERKFEAHYFDANGSASVEVPAGGVIVEALKGFENGFFRRQLTVAAGTHSEILIRLAPLNFTNDTTSSWISGDVHVHMNYAGTYRATPATLLAQMQAENVNVVQNLIVNKEQRFPDIEYAGRMGKVDPVSFPNFQILDGQEFHTSYWGHLGLLDTKHVIIPGYAGYPNTPAASISPTNADVADMGHAMGGLVGYVHPFDEFPEPEKDATITDELPVDVALGKVDYYEVLGFSDHKASAAVWYKLLNLGYHIPAAAGTDAMTNYASLRGPVGLNRVYVQLPKAKPWTMQQWLAGLRQGHTFATNGPLLRFTLGGQRIGGELKLATVSTIPFTASMRSIVPIDHLDVVCNGKIQASVPLSGDRQSADAKGGIHLPTSAWCVLRAWAEKAEYPILDIYPYATTSPIYVSIAGKPFSSPEDAKYFVNWIDRLIANAEAHTAYNTPQEKESVLKELRDARTIFAAKESPPNP
jgi:Tol biopolymer transport system component